MTAPAVRREVVALCQVAHRLGLIADGRGGYSLPRGVSLERYGQAQAKAVAHELQALGGVLGRLEQLTAPAPSKPATKLPAERSVAHTLLVVLAHDQAGKDHDHLRVHTCLTDAELAVRIAGVGPNSVRPRRVELVRRGLVEAVPDTSPTRWRLTAMGDVLLQRRPATHLMDDSLLDACGTAPPGSLSVTPVRADVTCPACRQLPEQEVAADA